MKLALHERQIGSAKQLVPNRRVNDVRAVDTRNPIAVLI